MNEHDDDVHDQLRMSLGAFVLGHLDAAEQERVRAHVDTCTQCRADLDELMPIATALVAADPTASAGEPPADLGARIEQRIRAERRSDGRGRAVRAAAIATLAGAAAAATVVVGIRVTEPDPDPAIPLEAVAVDERAEGVVASADLVAHTWGVEVKLEVTGLDAGARYDVTVVGADGTDYPAGAFIGTGANTMRCNLNASVLREAASAFEVRDADGEVVLSSTFA